MATHTSSIDELLSTETSASKPIISEQKGHHPDSQHIAEQSYDISVQLETSQQSGNPGQLESDKPSSDSGRFDTKPSSDTGSLSLESAQDENQSATNSEKLVDEYGNDIPPPKTYTEEELNERINQRVRDRLARLERNTQPQVQPSVQQQQQAQKSGFKYNADSQETWQQQLESFVDQVADRREQRKAYEYQIQQEQRAQAEFEARFQSGMNRFKDFQDVVASQPLTDDMVKATRGMQDPAAFLYAASRRAPEELAKIAAMKDPYHQVAAMGKLEEKMKATKATTKAPKPLSRTNEDMVVETKSKREPTIEDLIAQSEAKRRAIMNSRRK